MQASGFGGLYPQKLIHRKQSALASAVGLDFTTVVADFWRNELQNYRLVAMTTAFIRLCGRVSDRTLIFGLVCFTIGVWVGRLTAHKSVLWGLLGN